MVSSFTTSIWIFAWISACKLIIASYKPILFISLPATIIYLITYVAGYFSGFFNTIFERIAGVLSLTDMSTEEIIDQNNKQQLKETKSFFQDRIYK